MAREPDRNEKEIPRVESETSCCKVGRTAMEYGIKNRLPELNSHRKSGKSFREVTRIFNTWIVEQALKHADISDDRSIHAALVGENIADDIYHSLYTDETSDVEQTEVRARLSAAGVDVDRLESSFVSHVTIRSHLKECVRVEPDPSPPKFEKIANTARGAKNRAKNVIQSTFKRGARHGQIQTDSLRVEILVKITCEECGDTFYLAELLEKQRCSCDAEPKDNT